MKKDKKNKFESNRKYFSICIYAIITFCICLMIFKFTNSWQNTKMHITQFLGMFTPFLIAFLIAYFINPIIRRIDKLLFGKIKTERFKKVHKLLSLIIAYILLVGFIVLVLNVVIPQVVNSISQLVVQSPAMLASMEESLGKLVDSYPQFNLGEVETFINENIGAIFDYTRSFMTNILPAIFTAGVSIISFAINIVLAFVISCYLMWDKERLLYSIKRIIYAFFEKTTAVKIIDIVGECNEIFSKYIIGKAIDSLIIGILCFIIMCILRLPYAALISLFVGITNMIPYFGPFIGAVPGAIILLIVDPRQAIIFIIMIFLLQQFDGAILGPKILGDSTGLQPIWIIFAITVGGSVAGVLGMFLGVPIVAVLAHLLNKLVGYMIQRRERNMERLEPEIDSPEETIEEKENISNGN